MEYKKYIIFDDLPSCVFYLSLLNSSLREKNLINSEESWDTPRKVGENTNTFSKRYWLKKPPKDFFEHSLKSIIDDSSDILPSDINEDIYKIYNFINEDSDKKIKNYLLSPASLDYKKDVNLRFAIKEHFDIYGHLVKSEYYEKSQVTSNPLGIREEIFNNKILEVEFDYYYGTDGYLNYRNVNRTWFLVDDSKGSSIMKTKFYSNNKAKKAGERRRKNVQNIMENKVGTALFLTKGSALVGGDGTFNTVAEADEYGKPLLNSLYLEFNSYVTNNETATLLNSILNIDEIEYDWIMGIDPVTGKTIKQLAYDIIRDSIMD